MDGTVAARGRRGGVSTDRRDQRVHRRARRRGRWRRIRRPPIGSRQVLFDAAEAIRLAAVLLAPIMPASSAEILRRVGSSSDGLRLDRDGRWRNEGERLLVQEGSLWPRKETTTMTDNPYRRTTPRRGHCLRHHRSRPRQAPARARPAAQHPAPERGLHRESPSTTS